MYVFIVIINGDIPIMLGIMVCIILKTNHMIFEYVCNSLNSRNNNFHGLVCNHPVKFIEFSDNSNCLDQPEKN